MRKYEVMFILQPGLDEEAIVSFTDGLQAIMAFVMDVAVHPAHQGRGLARTLLYAGMQLLQARGATRAVLGTSSDNLAMQAAARAAGYRVESERVWLSWRAGE